MADGRRVGNRRYGQGIWTEGPGTPYTTYQMPEAKVPANNPPPSVNSGATRNYGGVPGELDTVPSRYKPYRPPIRQLTASLTENEEYIDPQTGVVTRGSGWRRRSTNQTVQDDDASANQWENDEFFESTREAEPLRPSTAWRSTEESDVFSPQETTSDVLDTSRPYKQPSPLGISYEDQIEAFRGLQGDYQPGIDVGAPADAKGRRKGSKRPNLKGAVAKSLGQTAIDYMGYSPEESA